MIGRIRTRDEFERLRRDGRRVRSGPLWCSYVLDSTIAETRVAFAIGRPVGNAVARNRLRRRIRALLERSTLPSGLLLVGAVPGSTELTFDQLRDRVASLVGRLPAADVQV